MQNHVAYMKRVVLPAISISLVACILGYFLIHMLTAAILILRGDPQLFQFIPSSVALLVFVACVMFSLIVGHVIYRRSYGTSCLKFRDVFPFHL